jgi:hypothetical protein
LADYYLLSLPCHSCGSLDVGIPTRRPRFNLLLIHVGFVDFKSGASFLSRNLADYKIIAFIFPPGPSNMNIKYTDKGLPEDLK